MKPHFWFFPVQSGDFRLIRVDDTSCELTVENPTGAELVVLGNLATAAAANGWTNAPLVFAPQGETVVRINAPIEQAGLLVSGSVHKNAKLWTAVRHEGGQVIVVSGLPAPSIDSELALSTSAKLAPGAAALIASPARVAVPPSEPPVEAAVTIRKPHRGCPAPTSCERRASEVLRTFSTERQMDTWTRGGYMHLVGNRTGRSYTLFHRDEAANRNLSHALIEQRTGDAVCCWDSRVPAAEEALGIKLAVEHREGWLRRLPRGPAKLAAMDDHYRESWPQGRVIPTVRDTPFDSK